jgi:carbonic anhydrase
MAGVSVECPQGCRNHRMAPFASDADPHDEFADLVEANHRHQATFSGFGLPSRAARGLAILTCIDTRLDPLAMLGLRPGDAKIVRNAGARVTDDALRSLALSTALLGVERIAVIAHTHCALARSSDDELRAAVAADSGGDTDDFDPLAVPDQRAALLADVERVRASPLIRKGITVAGFIYDVDTGELRPVG